MAGIICQQFVHRQCGGPRFTGFRPLVGQPFCWNRTLARIVNLDIILGAIREPVHEIGNSLIMAIMQILEYPDPRLRTKATPVGTVDESIQKLADDMLETMYLAPGIGLAATQVNVHKRLLVADVSEEHDQPRCFINPEIIETDGVETTEEGCLSVPGVFERVERSERIRIRALDRDGQPFEETLDGMLAVCVQHEIDHLNGKLFVDYLSDLKRQRIRKKLDKTKRSQPSEPDALRTPVI